MRGKFNLFILAFALLAFTIILYADFAETAVYFTVPISISFTVTLPGNNIYSSNTTQPPSGWTADIYFNSTIPTNKTNLEPCVAPGTHCQNSSQPIFQYDNTGTVNITLFLKFNQTLPGGVEVFMNSSNGGGANWAIIHGGLIPLNETQWASVAIGLPFAGTNVSNAYLFANFTAYTGTNIRYLVHNSTT